MSCSRVQFQSWWSQETTHSFRCTILYEYTLLTHMHVATQDHPTSSPDEDWDFMNGMPTRSFCLLTIVSENRWSRSDHWWRMEWIHEATTQWRLWLGSIMPGLQWCLTIIEWSTVQYWQLRHLTGASYFWHKQHCNCLTKLDRQHGIHPYINMHTVSISTYVYVYIDILSVFFLSTKSSTGHTHTLSKYISSCTSTSV